MGKKLAKEATSEYVRRISVPVKAFANDEKMVISVDAIPRLLDFYEEQRSKSCSWRYSIGDGEYLCNIDCDDSVLCCGEDDCHIPDKRVLS